MLDTDQLRSFLAIVDTGSFTRAADRVNKTQSAVSMHVRRLEERIGRELFVKQGRGARLSTDGEKLVEHARRMLQVEAAALSDLRAVGLSGRVTLGIPDDYAEPFLPDIVERFTRNHPQVEMSVICDPSVVLAERMQNGDLDVAVVTDCEQIKGLEIVREEPASLGGRPAGRTDRGTPAASLALSTPSCAWRHSALHALEEAGIPARLFMVSSNYAAIAPIVQAGLALTVLPEPVVSRNQRIVPPEAGLPQLPPCRVGLLRGASSHSALVAALADDIRASLSLRLPVREVPEAVMVGQVARRRLMLVEE